METFLANKASRVWLILMGLTLASAVLGLDDALDKGGSIAYLSTVAILLIALFKVRLVLRHFMEVAEAPLWLQRSTDGWIAALLLALLWCYA